MSSDHLTAYREFLDRVLPAGYGFEWTGTAYQEKAAAGQTGTLVALAVQPVHNIFITHHRNQIAPRAHAIQP